MKEMNISDGNMKSLAWAFHPSETVRLLRVMQLKPLDYSLDLTVTYSAEPKTGVVVWPDASMDALKLQLHYAKVVNGIKDVMVYSDGSKDEAAIKDVCKAFGCELKTSGKKLPSRQGLGSIGEQACFADGLEWAKANKCELLVKMSTSTVPCFKWIGSLQKLAYESDGTSFTSNCEKTLAPFRTECVGLSVSAWTSEYAINSLKTAVDNEMMLNLPFWMNSMSKQLAYQNFSKKNEAYRKSHMRGELHSGYVQWTDVLGVDSSSPDGRAAKTLCSAYSSDSDVEAEARLVFKGE